MKQFRFLTSLMPAIGILIASIIVNYRIGYFDRVEANQYISVYLSSRPFIQKMFDNTLNDIATNFRGREFANIFNYLDAQFILLSAKIGIYHFLSFTHYLSLLVISILFLILVYKKTPQVSHLPLSLFLYLFLLSPAPFFTGHYFRTSKILVALEIILSIFLYSQITDHLKHKKIRQIPLQLIGIFIFSFLFGSILGLSDELGIAAVVILSVCGFLSYFKHRYNTIIPMVGGLLTSFLVIYAYRHAFGPYIIYQITGNIPPLWSTDTKKLWSIQNYLSSVNLFLTEYIGNFFANTRIIGGILISIVSLLITIRALQKDTFESVKQLPPPINTFFRLVSSRMIIFLAAFAMLTVVMHLMTLTQQIFLTDLRQLHLIYYPLPFAAFILASGLLLIPKAVEYIPTHKSLVTVVLGIILLGNILAVYKNISYVSSLISTHGQIISADPILRDIQTPVLSQDQIDTIEEGKEVILQMRYLLNR